MQNKASSQIKIRPLQKEDISELVDWIVEIPLWQRYKLSKELAEKNFQSALKTTDQIIVALIDQQICGFAWLMPKGFVGRSPYLKMIGVKAGYQGFGLGQELISYLEQDKTELFLLVSDFNISAQEFYKKQGYSHIGEIPNYILDDVNELIFYKRLPIS